MSGVTSTAAHSHTGEVWVRAIEPTGERALVELTKRETASRVRAVYRVDRRHEPVAVGSTLLFHGSGLANCLSILSQGLRVKPPGVAMHGSAFGNGIYFSNSFTKSRAYCSFHQGVGFILLCEVQLGRQLPSQGDFHGAVTSARLQVAKHELGLLPDTKPSEHPELKRIFTEIQQEIQSGLVENIEGTGCDSFHFRSPAAPDPLGTVVVPNGCGVPAGRLVTKDGKAAAAGAGRDELIVYHPDRVRVRYIIEMREETTPKLKDVKTGIPAKIDINDHDNANNDDAFEDVSENCSEADDMEEGSDDDDSN